MWSIERESKQDNPNYKEICRRFIADEEDFKVLDDLGEHITINNDRGSNVKELALLISFMITNRIDEKHIKR